MGRFVEGQDRGQITLFPDCLEDWIGEDDPVRVSDARDEVLLTATAQNLRCLAKLLFRAPPPVPAACLA